MPVDRSLAIDPDDSRLTTCYGMELPPFASLMAGCAPFRRSILTLMRLCHLINRASDGRQAAEVFAPSCVDVRLRELWHYEEIYYRRRRRRRKNLRLSLPVVSWIHRHPREPELKIVHREFKLMILHWGNCEMFSGEINSGTGFIYTVLVFHGPSILCSIY